MDNKPVNIEEKFALFDDRWAPKVIAELNDYQFKLAKAEGEFTWHQHDDTDETFIVIDGQLTIHFENSSIVLKAGELFVVPRGVVHKPVAETVCRIMLVEPRGVANTGSERSELTAPQDQWI